MIKKIATVIIVLAVLVMAVNPAGIEAATKKAALNKKAVTHTMANKEANSSVTLKVKKVKQGGSTTS